MTMRQLTLASLTSLVCTCWCGTATVSACLLSVRSCKVTRGVAGTRAAAHLEVHAGVEQQEGEERHGAVGDQVHVDDVHLVVKLSTNLRACLPGLLRDLKSTRKFVASSIYLVVVLVLPQPRPHHYQVLG